MADEENVNAGSETSGDQTEASQETSSADTAAETAEKTEGAAQDAGDAAEQKAGDPCTCPDGREGTLADQAGTLVCLPNQG